MFSLILKSALGQTEDKAFKNGWKLVFFDEFDSNGLDQAKWKSGFSWGRCLPGNLAYSPEKGNIFFNDGKMIINLRKEKVIGICDDWDSLYNYKPYQKPYDYTSGIIFSEKSFKYGYFETRFKAPAGKGYNAACWLFGAKRCEIDVFELLGSEINKAHMTLHWENDDPFNGSQMCINKAKIKKPYFNDDYHVVASEWTKDKINWFIDNKKVPLKSKSLKLMSRHIPDVDMTLILDLGLGGMDGNPDKKTPYPADFIIDYVRAYSQESTEKPLIKGQRTIIIKPGEEVVIKLADLNIKDHYNIYPYGFKLSLSDSGHISGLKGGEAIMMIPVKVSDGIDESNYNIKILISDSNYLQEQFPTGYDITTNSDSCLVVIQSYNGQFFFDNLFLADDRWQLTDNHIERKDDLYILKADNKISGKYFLVIQIYNKFYRYPVIF